MTSNLTHPLMLDAHAADPCASCEARSVSVCNAIPETELGRLAALAQATEVPAGSCFIREGDPADCFFNITAGTAKLYKLLADGRRQITGFVGVGHFLGLAVSDTYAFSAEAIEPVRLCRFSRPKLRHLLDHFPLMEKRLLEVAANELVAAQEQMLLLGRKTARERLASFLLAQSSQGMPCGHSRSLFKLPMTRADVSDYLGLTIETVSRSLTRLRNEGMIDVFGTDMLILDRAALASLADGMA
jgi:CRP/FNR family transcriptional regulator, anaerobic regulatory protein